MFDLGILLTSFVLVFFAELGDKTQLVAFSLTSRGNKPLVIFLASSSALVCSTLIAAFLGGAAANFVPKITSYISGGLFLVFGAVILLSKEPPMLKQGFLEAVLLENNQFKYLPKIFKSKGSYDSHIMNIMRQEQSHAEFFKMLIKEKKLFKDDINEDERLESIIETLKVKKDIRKMSYSDALKELIHMEQAGISFFELIHEHLDEDHHNDDALQQTLKTIIEEERKHIAFYETLLQESAQ